MAFSAAVLFNYDGPRTKLLTSLMNNVEGRWFGNIYEHFSLKFRDVCVEISFVNIDERL